MPAKPGQKQLSFFVDEEVYNRVVERSGQIEASRSSLLRHLVKRGLEENAVVMDPGASPAEVASAIQEGFGGLQSYLDSHVASKTESQELLAKVEQLDAKVEELKTELGRPWWQKLGIGR